MFALSDNILESDSGLVSFPSEVLNSQKKKILERFVGSWREKDVVKTTCEWEIGSHNMKEKTQA